MTDLDKGDVQANPAAVDVTRAVGSTRPKRGRTIAGWCGCRRTLCDSWGLEGLVGGRHADIGLVSDPPVGSDSPLSRCQADGVVADQAVQLVLDNVLDPGPLGCLVGLWPEVGLRTGSTSELQGDEVVFLVVALGAITLVRVPGASCCTLSSVV